jgi:hypothetical protein
MEAQSSPKELLSNRLKSSDVGRNSDIQPSLALSFRTRLKAAYSVKISAHSLLFLSSMKQLISVYSNIL